MPAPFGAANMRMMTGTFLLSAMFLWSSPDPSPSLAGIAHLALRVSDVQKSREFYRVLGFEQSFEFADPGKPLVSYIKINDRQFIELYGRADDSQPAGLLHICYETPDIEALRNEYDMRGLNPPASRKARAGNLLFLFRDPEGQILEYTQYLPGSLHFEDRGKHLGERRISEHLVRADIAVQDVNVEHLFYTSKLAFQDIGVGGVIRLRLPGNSGDEVELVATTLATKPRLVFTVANLARAAEELRSRAIAVRTDGASVSVTDPDGTVIVFTEEKNEYRVKSKE
jgi:catechol 2,3-dioxygenase-like lactoylglutathione lyase family enzyme